MNTRPPRPERAELLSADAVAHRLNIKRETVYAYVSRGLLHRVSSSNGLSLFDPLEVEAISGRSRKAARPPAPGPGFCSGLTVISGGQPFYRGHAVCDLARKRSFEQVAHWLWTGEDAPLEAVGFGPADDDEPLGRIYRDLPASALPVEKMRALVALAAAGDPMRHDLMPQSVMAASRRLLTRLVSAMPRLGDRAQDRPVEGDERFAALLWSRLSPLPPAPEIIRVLDATLVLIADHDLGSPSTLAVRVAASARVDIYCALNVGLHSGGGAVQDASSLAVETYLDALRRGASVGEIVGEQLRSGRDMPGFGHRAYPDGDPRAALILTLLRESGFAAERMDRLDELLAIQKSRGFTHPNIGFAIAALSHLGLMVRGAGEAVFNLARCAGWTAHALEEYKTPRDLPRLKSVYVGLPPITR